MFFDLKLFVAKVEGGLLIDYDLDQNDKFDWFSDATSLSFKIGLIP